MPSKWIVVPCCTEAGIPVESSVYQFAEFTLDASCFALFRDGQLIKLQRKPLELLILLAGSGGRLVTRKEIAERLWTLDVYVDSEHGINTYIRKIRIALNEDAEQPRFLQTVPGMGYRFSATVKNLQATNPEAPGPTCSVAETSDGIGSRFYPEGSDANAGLPVLPGKVETVASAKLLDPTSRRGFLLTMTGLTTALVLGGLRGIWTARHPGLSAGAEDVHSIAVLPLDNFSHDPGQDYLASGLTDELITQLAKNTTLRIVSRGSAMHLKDAHGSLREVAKRLGVDSIIEGSIVRTDSRIRLSLQLIQVETDTHLWAETYDREESDLDSISSEAATAIAQRVHRSVVHPIVVKRIFPAAHDAYLRGHDLWMSGNYDDALPYFQKAVELQPDYALGWCGLAFYYGGGAVIGKLKPADSFGPLLSTAEKAVELDDSSPQAHLARGGGYFIARVDVARAELDLHRAIALDPRFAEPHHFRGKILAALGRHDEAIREQLIAMELDPFSQPWGLAKSYLLARRYDAALEESQYRLKQLPTNLSLLDLLESAYHMLGRYDEAIAARVALTRLSDGPAQAAEIKAAYSRGGYRALQQSKLAKLLLLARKQYVPPERLASAYANLGKKEQALANLELAFKERSPLLLWMQCYPEYDFLHHEPRYRVIVEGMNISSPQNN